MDVKLTLVGGEGGGGSGEVDVTAPLKFFSLFDAKAFHVC